MDGSLQTGKKCRLFLFHLINFTLDLIDIFLVNKLNWDRVHVSQGVLRAERVVPCESERQVSEVFSFDSCDHFQRFQLSLIV